MRLLALLAPLALLLSGCTSDAPAATPDVGAPLEDTAPLPSLPTTAVAVDFTGDVGPAFCVHGLPATAGCVNSRPGATPVVDRERTFLAPSVEGLLSADLQVSWDALLPVHEQLLVQWGSFSGCPDACTLERAFGTALGPSPVAIVQSATTMAAGETFGVYVRAATTLPVGDVEAVASQPFTVTGTLLVP